MTKPAALGGLLVAAIFAACGGGGSGGPVAIGDYYATQLAAICNVYVTCDYMRSTAACEADLGSALDAQQATLIADVNAGVIAYDADAERACADELQTNPCEFDASQHAPDCNDVFTGTVATGGPCFLDEDCASLATCDQTIVTCDRSTTCCSGTCGAASVSPGAIGEPCGTGATCVAGAYCQSATTGSGGATCAAQVATVGAACDPIASACGSGLYCSLGSDGSGTCKQPAASGATCVTTDAIPCADTRDYCDATSRLCTRASGVGGACAAGGMTCLQVATCVDAACVPNLDAGDVCSTGSGSDTGGPQCLGNTVCIDGTCQLDVTVGGACM